ncbi:hypothetical protein ACQP00_45575 [Dactylosporangium sp. CS-047395]|uniref:hypothetical protein n=1 Tax=Dactylosporangium sp. CS-047395 TaxID=3239936 RepID=UPI003D90FD08
MKLDLRAFVLRWRLVELAAGLCALGLLLRARAWLPAKYFYDGDYIAALNDGTTGIRPDAYYRSIAGFYASLGLDTHPRLTAALQLALMVAAVTLALRPAPRARRWSTMALAFCAIVLGGVYLTQYSKDAVVLLFVLPVLVVLRVREWASAAPFVAAGALTLYGALFRSYWLVLAALFVTAYVALRRGRRPVLLLPTAAAMFVLAAAGTLVVRHDSLDTFRAAANAGRGGSPDAVTLIAPFLDAPHSIPAGLVNAMLTFVALLVPVPLLLAGGFVHVSGAILLGALSVRMFAAARTSAGDRALGVAVTLLLAFVVTQALFAPDYGSHLKHLTPMLPLAIFALARADAKRYAYARSAKRYAYVRSAT